MADATKLYNFKYFEWSRPDAPSIELTAPYNIGDTTLYWSAPPLDENGDIVDGGFSVGVSREDGYVINFWIPEGDVAADGLSATNVVVQDLAGTDYDTRNADFDSDLPAGSRVFRVISPVEMQILLNTLQGLIATGGAGFTVGTEGGAETMTLYRTTTAGVKLGVFRWFLGAGKAQFSNDGLVWVSIDDTVASSLFKISMNDTTPGYASDKLVEGQGITLTILNGSGDEDLEIAINVDEFAGAGLEDDGSNNLQINVDATTNTTEINGAGEVAVKIDPDGGITSNSNGLAQGQPSVALTAGEDITVSSAPQAIFISRGTSDADAVVDQAQLTENDTDADVYGFNFWAQTFTLGANQDKVTRVDLMLAEMGNPNGNFQIDIYAVDGSNKPTGASLGSQTTVATNVGANLVWLAFTFSSVLTLTPSTQYAIVAKAISGDSSNYIAWQTGSGNTYANGQPWQSTDAGATWSSATNDFAFRVWSYESQTAGRIYQSDEDALFRGACDGFISESVTEGNDVSVQINGQLDGFTGLTAGADYYVSSTAGGITTTANGLPVGRAISTTTLDIDINGGFTSEAKQTASLNLTTSTIATQYFFFKCGFKPSRVELYLAMSVQTGATSNTRLLQFGGSFVGTTLYGIASKIGENDATNLARNVDAMGVSTLSVIDGASAATLTLNSFSLTNSGFQFNSSVNASSSAGVNVIARCYR